MIKIHHLAFTADDLKVTRAFYDAVFGPLGYHRHLTFDHLCTWQGPGPELLVYQAKEALQGQRSELYAPGLHHVAFAVEKRSVVEAVYSALQAQNANVLDPPAEYPHYAPGYFAVFFVDPDGNKIEVSHIPHPTS